MKKQKPNLRPGVHDLKILSAAFQDDGRLKILHEPIEPNYRNVHWTLGPDKPGFARYMEATLGWPNLNPSNSDLRSLFGCVIRAEISEGSTGFVNLKRVIGVVSRPGPILNTNNSVIDGKAGGQGD